MNTNELKALIKDWLETIPDDMEVVTQSESSVIFKGEPEEFEHLKGYIRTFGGGKENALRELGTTCGFSDADNGKEFYLVNILG